MSAAIELKRIDVGDGELEVRIGGETGPSAPVVCVAHPIDQLGDGTIRLLRDVVGARVVCVGRRDDGDISDPGAAQDRMVDDVESVRTRLGLDPWAFWGMSGGGWLAQLYAKRHPGALLAIVIESSCPCLRERVRDPACALSPAFPATREVLTAAGLYGVGEEARAAEDGAPYEWVDLPGVAAVLRRVGGPAVLVAPASAPVEVRRGLQLFLSFDARPWLASLSVPALVVAGSDDPVAPVAHSLAIHERLPNSEFLAISGAGHLPITTRNATLRDAARAFLAR